MLEQIDEEVLPEPPPIVNAFGFGTNDLNDLSGLDDPVEYPLLPSVDTDDKEFGTHWVDYTDRGSRDVVLSGPVIGGWGPGRWFANRRNAWFWAVRKYGEERVKPMRQSLSRWSLLVKNLRAA